MKNFKSLSLLSAILILTCSCEIEKNLSFGFEKYHDVNDTCRSIQFFENSKIQVKRDCEKHALNDVIINQKLNGEIIELYCNDLTYKIDSVGSYNDKYIRIFDKNNNICQGIHLLEKNSYWVVTPLKQGEGIDFHFTTPVIYRKNKSTNKLELKESLTIKISTEPKEGIFYIAYNQEGPNNFVKDSKGNFEINLNEDTNCYKTNFDIDPSLLAFKKYNIEVFDTLTNEYVKLPILFHNEYNKYRLMSLIEKDTFLKKKKIYDKFIAVKRFNPGRQRIVNKKYKEEIFGQVQSFEIIKTNKY